MIKPGDSDGTLSEWDINDGEKVDRESAPSTNLKEERRYLKKLEKEGMLEVEKMKEIDAIQW
jgi:hypothetical protein